MSSTRCSSPLREPEPWCRRRTVRRSPGPARSDLRQLDDDRAQRRCSRRSGPQDAIALAAAHLGLHHSRCRAAPRKNAPGVTGFLERPAVSSQRRARPSHNGANRISMSVASNVAILAVLGVGATALLAASSCVAIATVAVIGESDWRSAEKRVGRTRTRLNAGTGVVRAPRPRATTAWTVSRSACCAHRPK